MAVFRRRSNVIVFAIIALAMAAFGLIMPVMPTYIETMGGGGRDMGLMTALFSVTQFAFSLTWGNLSDTLGRKPVILAGLAGCAVVLWLYGRCTQLWAFYAARALSGVMVSATFPTALAYMADTTSEQERGDGMSMASAAMYAGMMGGPALSGWLASIRLSLPFYVGAGLAAVLTVVVLLLLPESLPPEQRSRRGVRQIVRGPDLAEMGRALRSPMGHPLVLSFLLALGLNCFWSMFGMYALHRYGLGPAPVGTIMACIGVCSAGVQLFLVGPLARRWGEAPLIRAALLAGVFGFAALLLAWDFASLLVAACACVTVTSLARPLVATLISRAATQGQGQAMGLDNSFMSVGQIVGPTWSGLAFDVSLLLPFASGAVTMLIGWLTMEARRPGARRAKHHAS